MPESNLRRRGRLAAALVGVALLTACGSEDEASGESASAAMAEFSDIVGVWGTVEICAGEPLIIASEFVAVADESCTITDITRTGAAIRLDLLCPAADGGEPTAEWWTITPGSAPPVGAIAIERAGAIADLIRCPAD